MQANMVLVSKDLVPVKFEMVDEVMLHWRACKCMPARRRATKKNDVASLDIVT